jgi:hypothetical protein
MRNEKGETRNRKHSNLKKNMLHAGDAKRTEEMNLSNAITT